MALADKDALIFEKHLVMAERQLPFLGMNPVNADSEKKKFFASKDYEPVFRYAELKLIKQELLKKLDSIKLGRSVINDLLREKYAKFRKTQGMLLSMGKSQEFTSASKELFGVPSKILLKKAEKILKNEPVCEQEELTSMELAGMLKKVLSSLGLSRWNVGFKQMTSNAAVSVSKKTLYLKKKSMFPRSFIRRVMAHEIGAHVLRGDNGEKQPYEMFMSGLPNYLMTEEGLAVNTEELFDSLKINTLRAYAGRVMAVHLSLDAGFRRVYEELNNYFDEHLSWRLALRAKRGLGDSSLKGAYTKDHLYLRGYYEVKNFLDEKGEKGLAQLYYGKIGLEHVPLMKKISGLHKPGITPASDIFKKTLAEFAD